MSEILTVRDAIRDFIRKFDEVTTPLLRFLFSYIMFASIRKLYGYSDLFDRSVVIFLLALICALASDTIAVLMGGVVLLINGLSVSTDIGILHLVLFILLYCTYMRMFPDCAWILAFVPIMFMWKLYFVIPIIVVIFAGASGIVPTAFGALLYYVAMAVREIKDGNMLEDKEFQAYNYVIDSVIKNKAIISLLIVFAVVILLTYILYRLPFDYAFYVAIAVGGVLNILVSLLVDGVTDAGITMGKVVSGSFLGIVIGLAVQLCKSLLDYAHKETVQFEDDDYYYYVKAIPKFTSRKKAETPKVSDAVKHAISGKSQNAEKEDKIQAKQAVQQKQAQGKQPAQPKQAQGKQSAQQQKQAQGKQPAQPKQAQGKQPVQQQKQSQGKQPKQPKTGQPKQPQQMYQNPQQTYQNQQQMYQNPQQAYQNQQVYQQQPYQNQQQGYRNPPQG